MWIEIIPWWYFTNQLAMIAANGRMDPARDLDFDRVIKIFENTAKLN